MQRRICLIGLDPPQVDELRPRIKCPVVVHDTLPRMIVRDGELLVTSPSGFDLLPVSKVVFHGIFADDHDFIAGLALWGGPCMPSAYGMLDCRLKLPCLVRALRHTAFGYPPRGFASAGAEYESTVERVAKWGNWHCGENKARFAERWSGEEAAVVEQYLEGDAIRVVLIGDQHWQIRMAGDGWLKSIHHPDACITPTDARLVEDTRRVAAGLGLEIAANDYLVTPDGTPHLLEVNHIPNVTRFPIIWQAYANYISAWLS